MNNTIQFEFKTLNELSVSELHGIMHLRNACFIVEQQAIYQELDGKDIDAIHCLYIPQNSVLAYIRLSPNEPISGIMKLSRLCVKHELRHQHIGSEIIKFALSISHRYQCHTVILSAQKYLLEYYQSFGFTMCSDIYLINQIEHIDLILKQRNYENH